MKRLLSIVLATVMLLGLLAGCGGAGNPAAKNEAAPSDKAAETKEPEAKAPEAKKDVSVKILNLKVEIADALGKMPADYLKENPGVNLKIETIGGGTDYNAALMAKFQSGDAPDIFVNGGFAGLDQWLEKSEELTNEPWVKDMVEGTGIPMTKDGKLYGQPQAIEGFGFAYNKALFKKAGITEIPKTLTQLEDAAKKLQAAGIQPFVNSYAEWWVLGCHNVNLLLSQQPDPQKFIDDVAAGKVKTRDNPITPGWLKLLDITVKYGQKNMTTAGDYATSVNAFAAGKGAMIQQGNWIQPDIDKVDPNLEVGFIPMPTSDTPEEKIYAGVPNFWSVNKESKVKEEAKAWLNWLVSSDSGKRYITEEFKSVPAFKSIQGKDFKGLNQALAAYATDGKVFSWSFPRLPTGAINDIGAVMMKYLAGQIDGNAMADGVDKAIVDKAKAKQ